MIRRAQVLAWAPELRAQADSRGRVTPRLQATLGRIERQHAASFTPGARAAFQTLAAEVGARIESPLLMPEDDTPYWLLAEHPLAGHRSTSELPRRAASGSWCWRRATPPRRRAGATAATSS